MRHNTFSRVLLFISTTTTTNHNITHRPSPASLVGPPSTFRHGYDNDGLTSSSSIDDSVMWKRTALHNNGDEDVTTMTAAAATSFITGTAAFYTTAFVSQLMQYKLLRLSTGTRPAILPSSIGMVTVAMGSWMGHAVGLGTTHAVLCAAATARRQAEYCNNDASSWGLRSIRACSENDDDTNGKRITNILTQLSAIGNTVWKSTLEMTRPLFLGVSIDNHNNNNSNSNFYYNNNKQLTKRQRKERKEAWFHVGRVCILGLLTYKIGCRARFISLSPSSFTSRGSFARVSIPATPPPPGGAITNGGGFAYATASQRYRIEKLGRIFGCHTCGSRELFFTKSSSQLISGGPKFYGDHIPPISVAKQLNDRWYRKLLGLSVSQQFYPQCKSCSNTQGGLLSRAIFAGHRNLRSVGGGQESYFHGRRPRLSHMTGGIVAVLSVGGLRTSGMTGENNDDTNDNLAIDLVKSSRERMQFMQLWIEDVGMKTKEWIVNAWRDLS